MSFRSENKTVVLPKCVMWVTKKGQPEVTFHYRVDQPHLGQVNKQNAMVGDPTGYSLLVKNLKLIPTSISITWYFHSPEDSSPFLGRTPISRTPHPPHTTWIELRLSINGNRVSFLPCNSQLIEAGLQGGGQMVCGFLALFAFRQKHR